VKSLHASSAAALAHRLSGLALALFVPFHFWALGQALAGPQALQSFLDWTRQPLVKAGEWGLVLLLALHLALGLRVLALELLPWQERQKSLAAGACGIALVAGLAFALQL
jgi:fumarate reductase subunit D